MRKPWRNLFEPWRTETGWEFDLLRTLPPDLANQLHRRAWVRARKDLERTWRWWAGFSLLLGVMWLSMILVWFAGALVGVGGVGRVGLDLAFHLTLGVIVLHPLARREYRRAVPYVRGALADVLLEFAEDRLDTAPRNQATAGATAADRPNPRCT